MKLFKSLNLDNPLLYMLLFLLLVLYSVLAPKPEPADKKSAPGVAQTHAFAYI